LDKQWAKLGEYAGLVHGAIPLGTAGLADAIALFQGVLRPLGTLESDESVLVYVTKPDCTFNYPPEHRWAVAAGASDPSGPVRLPQPAGSTFTVYVQLHADTLVEPGSAESSRTDGVVAYWEWTHAAEVGGEFLPLFHEARYARRLW